MENSGDGDGGPTEKEWSIAALVKRKIVFAKRPMPVATS
jgi:hypothetical protein